MSDTYYCPHTASCPFHQNLVKYTNNQRTDVIIEKPHLEEHKIYDCLALIAIDDVESGIPMGRALQSKLSQPNSNRQLCSHIRLLNLINEASDFASYVMTRDVAKDEQSRGK